MIFCKRQASALTTHSLLHVPTCPAQGEHHLKGTLRRFRRRPCSLKNSLLHRFLSLLHSLDRLLWLLHRFDVLLLRGHDVAGNGGGNQFGPSSQRKS